MRKYSEIAKKSVLSHFSMNNKITIHDKEFTRLFSSSEIATKIDEIATAINLLSIEKPIFISVLSGAFMFTSDLCKKIHNKPYIYFTQARSYEGLTSTGTITTTLDVNIDLQSKTIFILEDIVETGTTITHLYNAYTQRGAEKIYIVSLVYKPQAYKGAIPIDYVGFTIANDFIVGYGMDYNGLGRELSEIYVLQ